MRNGAVEFVVDTLRGARDDRVTGLGAEVAYFAMLSIFPSLVAVAAAVTTLSPIIGAERAGEVEETVIEWLQQALSDQARTVIDQVRDLFDRSNADLFTIALLVALWSGSRGIDAVIRAVTLVANDVETRPWWKRRLVSLALLLGTVASAALALSMFVVGPLLGGGRAIADTVGAGAVFATAWTWLRFPLVGLALTGWSLVVLHVSRPGSEHWKTDLPGAITATVLWLLATIGLRLYLQVLGSSNPVLGALGGPLILLLWLYLLALGLLIGAEVAQQFRLRRSEAAAA